MCFTSQHVINLALFITHSDELKNDYQRFISDSTVSHLKIRYSSEFDSIV